MLVQRLMLVVAVTAWPLLSLAQEPGSAPPDGAPPGGPGGPPFFGGPGGPPPMMFSDPASLLRMPAVQDELKLTDEQKKSVEAIHGEVDKEMRERGAKMQSLTPDQRRSYFEKARETFETERKETSDKLLAVLDEKQRERIDQLSLQRRGTAALLDDEVAEELKLTDKQRDRLEALRDESREAIQAAFEEADPDDRDAVRRKLDALRQKQSNRALKLLTAQQRKSFEDLQGEKFEFPEPPGPPRNRPPRRARPSE